MSNGLFPDQDQHSNSPDLGANCLPKLSADCKKRKVLKLMISLLALLITVNFPIYIDTISMDFSICILRDHGSKFLSFGIFLSPRLFLSKQTVLTLVLACLHFLHKHLFTGTQMTPADNPGKHLGPRYGLTECQF